MGNTVASSKSSSVNQFNKANVLLDSLKELTGIISHVNDKEGEIIASSIDKLVEAIIQL